MEALFKLPAEVSDFSPASKVWVYQSSRPFSVRESEILTTQLKDFTRQWTAHNNQLLAAGLLIFDRIIVLMVDESQTMASGCSIDSSVHFIQSLEKQYQVELFDRMLVNYFELGQWHTSALHALREKLQVGEITIDTLVVNPLVQTRSAFTDGFVIPARDCWIGDFLQ